MTVDLRQLKRASAGLVQNAANLTFFRYFYHNLGHADSIPLLVKGGRGVGKTTAILQILAQKKQIGAKVLYLSVDNLVLAGASLFEIAEQVRDEGFEWVAFDEVHKIENFATDLKSVIDAYPSLKILASGSSSLNLEQADLSRRVLKVSCFGMSFREYLNFYHDLSLKPYPLDHMLGDHEALAEEVVGCLKDEKLSLLDEFYRYLKIGYFPTYRQLQNESIYFEVLREAINKALEQDILSSNAQLTGRSIFKMKELLSVLAKSCPFVPDLKKLGEAIDVKSKDSLKNYLYLLHQAAIIRHLPKYGESISSLIKPEKIYLDNTNYLFALRDARDLNPGTIRETFAYAMLDSYFHIHSGDRLFAPNKGDLMTKSGLVFEIGGPNKGFSQIKGIEQSYVLADGVVFGAGRKVPLWMMGFIY